MDQKTKLRIEELERALAEQSARLATLEYERDAATKICIEGLSLLDRFGVKAPALLGDIPEAVNDNLDVFRNLLDRIRRLASQLGFANYLTRTGKDANLKDPQEEAPVTEGEVVLKEAAILLQNAEKVAEEAEKLNKPARAARKALQTLKKEDGALSPALKACDSILEVPVPSFPEQTRRTNPGRKTAPVSGSTVRKTSSEKELCPDCGTELVSIGKQIFKVKGELHSMYERLANVEQEICILECPKCHRVVSSMNADSQLPLTPEPASTLSSNVVVDVMYLQQEGIPANRIETALLKGLNVGHDTLNRSQEVWDDLYGRKLIDEILKEAAGNKVILADETPYRCLSMEGRGVCQKEKTEGPSQGYILGVGCPTNVEKPFALYYPLRGRNAQGIADVLSNFNPEVICTDAYEGYDSLLRMDGFAGIKRQSCLIHWRRKVIQAVEYDMFSGEIGKLSVEKAEALFKKQLRSESPRYMLLLIIEALRRLYLNERVLKRGPNESREAHLSRVQKMRDQRARPLMDQIDVIVKSLADSRLRKTKNGRYVAATGGTLESALTYYMNNREELRLFLDRPDVPCDTNPVERMMRPVAVLEGITHFRQSEKSMGVFCNMFSLIGTAELNGIERPNVWLKEFTAALRKHCHDAAWEDEIRSATGKDPNRKLRGWKQKFEKYSPTFDVTPWLPWNYGKQS